MIKAASAVFFLVHLAERMLEREENALKVQEKLAFSMKK